MNDTLSCRTAKWVNRWVPDPINVFLYAVMAIILSWAVVVAGALVGLATHFLFQIGPVHNNPLACFLHAFPWLCGATIFIASIVYIKFWAKKKTIAREQKK